MELELNMMVGGEAGQGVQSVGFILAKTFARAGYGIFADQDYESRIRGGHNFYRVRAKDDEVGAISEHLDMLIALNRESITLHQKELKSTGVAIFDEEKIKDISPNERLLGVPLERLAQEKAGNKLMTNTVALGAALGLVKFDFDLLASVLREYFTGSGYDIAEGNVRAARAGFDYAQENFGDNMEFDVKPIAGVKKMLLSGNEALALGAMAAGCKFMAGYPMTPSTPIMEYIADKGRLFNIVVVQPEDEISVINMVIGAAYAGVRAMTATSGGGFCLMVEGLSLAGMTETPIVVVLGQRPGPAIGLPTRTEQGELEFAIHAGHGEFPRAVLAPATIEDAFHIAVKAFNLAEKYQTPVIILTDEHLVSSYGTVAKFDLEQVKIERGQLLSEEEVDTLTEYKRYLITESGVSPRALPLRGKALVVTDSDEHDEEGHIIEDAGTRRQMMSKRLRKMNGLRGELEQPRVHHTPGAQMTLVGWGSTYGAITEAVAILQKEGVAANVLHLNELWPFPEGTVSSVLNGNTKSIVIENNATGQLARLIRAETGIKVNGTINKFDGRPFSPEYIIKELRKGVF